ncbi:MAG: glycosyltransferase family 2 protein [Lachnospiraceae bacterium]|nr:glycosyltransferase family 2 protein [Lachnospiraceae bacterium]
MEDKILLFIPMYNCEKQIVRVLGQLNDEVCSYLSEVIVINNRSTDNGAEAVVNYLKENHVKTKVSLLRNDQNYGLGGSQKVAFKYAIDNGFDYVIMLHGDDQGDISNILPYLKNKEYRNYDCFLGARFMKGSKLEGYSAFRSFGNRVYNMIYSIGCGKKIYDLGSGLNMYRVEILKSGFYTKYKDNLMFNYCMVLGQAFYNYKVKFFPILWREDDQVSNVKMVSQAMIVLKLLFSYMFSKKKFVNAEHRDKLVEDYTFKVEYTNS